MSLVLLTLVLVAVGSRGELDPTRILDTIQDVADFVDNQSNPLIDAYLGLTFSDAQMRLLLDQVKSQGGEQCPIGRHIAQTEEKLSKTIQDGKARRDANDQLWSLIEPELWEMPSQQNHFPLQNLDYSSLLSTIIDNEDIRQFALQGTPSEKDSDLCFLGLIHNCSVSQICWQAQTSTNPTPHGYRVTHRLLFLQIARQMGCENSPSFKNVNISATIRNLCETILAESKIIEGLNYPALLRDLLTEQILLCGMEGFQEFINLEWIEKILSWKTPYGCFTMSGHQDRTDIIVHDCSLHLSALAAAAFSTALRYTLENTTLNDCKRI